MHARDPSPRFWQCRFAQLIVVGCGRLSLSPLEVFLANSTSAVMHFFTTAMSFPKRTSNPYAPISASDSGDEVKEGLLGTDSYTARNTFWRRWGHFIIIQTIIFGAYVITILYMARQLQAENIHGLQLVRSTL